MNQPATRSAESLGKVTYETKPNTSNLVAGVIISALLFFGGLGSFGQAVREIWAGRPQNGEDWIGVIMFMGIGVALAVGGVYMFFWIRSLFGFRLRVCADGFSFTRRGIESVFAWDEIKQIRETVSHEKLPIVKGPARQLMPTKTSRSYTVVRCDGEEFYFDDNVIARASLLAGPLSNAAKTRDIQWDTTEERN